MSVFIFCRKQLFFQTSFDGVVEQFNDSFCVYLILDGIGILSIKKNHLVWSIFHTTRDERFSTLTGWQNRETKAAFVFEIMKPLLWLALPLYCLFNEEAWARTVIVKTSGDIQPWPQFSLMARWMAISVIVSSTIQKCPRIRSAWAWDDCFDVGATYSSCASASL